MYLSNSNMTPPPPKKNKTKKNFKKNNNLFSQKGSKSKLKQPHRKIWPPRENVINQPQYSPPPPKIKYRLKIFYYKFRMFNTHIRLYLPSPTSCTVSICTVSAFIFLTLTPNIPIHFSAILQHISPIQCTG